MLSIFRQISPCFSILKYRQPVRVWWYFYYSNTERTQLEKKVVGIMHWLEELALWIGKWFG